MPARLFREVLGSDEPVVSQRGNYRLAIWPERMASTLEHEREQTIPYLLSVLKVIGHDAS